MKKNLFLMAAAVIALAACSSEDLSINTEQQVKEEPVGVVFDTYVSNGTSAVTRAGNVYAKYGPYTITNMQDPSEGFGVFASYYAGTINYQDWEDNYLEWPTSNFMYNQQVTYSGSGSAWTYSPLMYWPNQTSVDGGDDHATDSQTGNTAKTDKLDRVSFFAYAPYQPIKTTDAGLDKSDGKVYDASGNEKTVGVTKMIKNTDALAPQISYKVATEPNASEDLLWAVAPYGGLNYTAVNGTPVQIAYGTSFVDMIKPAANTKIKFLFQHALSALKMSIVAAIDQVAPGGSIDSKTKIYINYIRLKSNTTGNGFATSGDLRLLNRVEESNLVANLPNWLNTTSVPLVIGKLGDYDNELNEVNLSINPNLQSIKDATTGLYTSFTNTGVTGTEVGLFANGTEGAGKDDMLMFIPVLKSGYSFADAKPLDVTVEIDYDVVTESANVDGGQVKVNNVIRKEITLPKYGNGRIYKLKLILGVSSVQFEAEAADWTTDAQDIDLPRNLD